MISCEEFNALKLPNRVNYVDSFYLNEGVSEACEREIKKLLRSIVDNSGENEYVRRKALTCMCEMTLVGKLKMPGTIDVLFDMARESDTFLVLAATKYLFLFREFSENEINCILADLSESENAEIASEAYFRLGLIFLFKSGDEVDEELFAKDALKANKYFRDARNTAENRMDAEYYYWVSEFILNAVKMDAQETKRCHQELVKKLWAKQVYGLHENISELDYKLYEVVNCIYRITGNKVAEWIDYREGITELCGLHFELLNASLSENLYEAGLLDAFKDLNVSNILYPYYRNSFQANLPIIKRLHKEYSEKSEEGPVEFLNILARLVDKKDKKKELDTGLLINLVKAFPSIDAERIKNDAVSIGYKNKPEALIKLFEKYSKETGGFNQGYITGSRQGDDVFNRISDNLREALKDYPIERMYAFQSVLSDVIRYIHFTLQAKNNYSNLLKFLFSSKAEEKNLQDSLIAFLKMNSGRASSYRPEVSDVADGGRVDILYDVDEITIPIELKRTYSHIDEEHIRECYLSQAQTYVHPYDQLGIFVLLDVRGKDKKSPINNVRELFDIMHLEPFYKVKQRNPDYVVTVIIPGNKIFPSDRSTYK